MTADELLRLPDNGRRYELIAGAMREMSPAGYEHGIFEIRLARRLANFVEDQQLGGITGGDTGFLISDNPDTILVPDVAFVAKPRFSATAMPKAFFPGAPDLAVEVLSPRDTIEEAEAKVAQWLDAGCKEVWVVHPRWKTIMVHRPGEDVRTYSADQTITSPDLLPGFACKVGEVFP